MKYKKIEAEINQKIDKSNQVSKSILDKARMEMQNERVQLFLQGKIGNRKRSLFSICLMPIMAAIIVIMSIFSLINLYKREPILRGTDIFAYNFTKLSRKETISIEEYNHNYNQKVKWVQNAIPKVTYEYYYKNKTILLEEQYELEEIQVNLYVSSLLLPTDFRDFNNFSNQIKREELYIYYDYVDGMFIARMSIMQYIYCFEITNIDVEEAIIFLVDFSKN